MSLATEVEVAVDPTPPRTALTAESARSVTIAGTGEGESQQRDADRLEAAQLEFDAQMRRFEQAKAQFQATIEQARSARTQRESLHASAFARLQARLETMPVIEQAKGILMAQHRCGPDEAFDLLRRASQLANIKINVLAARIVEQVASPGPGGGATHARPARQRQGRRPGGTASPAGHMRHRVA
jgi:hypothetical protein